MAQQLIVEADGGSRGNPGVAGYGSLVRDASTGKVLAQRAAPLGKESNNVAEYTGLIEGLRAVVEHAGGAQVTVRMDSKLVVEQMSGRWKIKHDDMKRLAAQARDLITELTDAGGSVTFEWIPRAKNKDADKLSNDGMDGVTVVRDDWGQPTSDAESDAPADAASEDDVPADEASDARGVDDALNEATKPLPKQQQRPAMGEPTRVVLVRHGVTDFTQQGLLDGRGGANPDLNDLGRSQADALAGAVADLVGPSVRVVASGLARAQQTAAPVARRLGVDVEVDDDWDEQCFGDWDSRSFRELHAEDAQGLSQLRVSQTYCPPGGESRDHVDARVARAFDAAVARGGSVVVVTHRIVIMSVLARLLGLDMPAAWRLAAAPGSLTGIEVWADGNAQIAFLNDTHHLR